jgi:PIN domain nuclease of toxin-antitoxin system
MSDYVADTHACAWFLTAPRKLGRRARAAFESAEAGRTVVWVPAAALIEVALLHGIGRIKIDVVSLLESIDDSPGLRFLGTERSQIEHFSRLRVLTDPYDRLIAAAALATGSKLITRDGPISDSGIVSTVWD